MLMEYISLTGFCKALYLALPGVASEVVDVRADVANAVFGAIKIDEVEA